MVELITTCFRMVQLAKTSLLLRNGTDKTLLSNDPAKSYLF